MNQKNTQRAVAGIIFIILGLVLVLKTAGVISFSVWSGFKTFWPLGLVIVGLFFIFRMRWLGFVFLFITLVTGVLMIAQNTGMDQYGDYREITQKAQNDENIKSASLDLDYGAGKISLSPGTEENILLNNIKTSDISDPKMTVEKDGQNAQIKLERTGDLSLFKGHNAQEWDIGLSPDIRFDLDLDYGAAEMDIDLSGLKVSNMEIDTGASETTITFARYPTKLKIDTGASSMKFVFPEGYGVVIEMDGGMTSTEFEGFEKKGKKYYSPGYEEGASNIEITIDAGAASFESRFY